MTLSFSSHSASPLSSDAVVLLSPSMFFWCFALAFGVMLSPCCRSPRSSRGYAVVLLLGSSDTCILQLSLLSVHPSVTATQGCSWGSLLQLDFVVVQFSKPMDDSCHVLQWVCLWQWDLAIISHLFCHQHRDDACCIADMGGCCIWTEPASTTVQVGGSCRPAPVVEGPLCLHPVMPSTPALAKQSLS